MICSKIASRYVLSEIRGLPSVMTAAQYSSSPKICYEQYKRPKEEPYDNKNMKLKRPLSPHLTIYARQLTSMTSITHRATGMILSGYFIALGCGALVLPNDVSHYINMVDSLSLSAPTLFAAKFTLVLPFGYHLANGMRHLMWDTGRALTLREVYTTGYIMMAAAVIISGVLAAL